MKATTVILAMGALLVLATTAQAKPEYFDVLVKAYPTYEKALSARSCANCHTSDSDFTKNLYGKQVAQQLLNAETKTLTPEILHASDALATNPGDISNLDKIKQGLALAAVAPAGTGGAPAAAGDSKSTAAHPGGPERKPFWPKNGFHPAIVHFPIALFIAALLLDLVGIVRNNPKFLVAGWYNLLMAAVSSFAGITTGLLALFTMGLHFKGLIFQHLITAILATIIMWILVILRVGKHDKMTQNQRIVYFVFALAGMILISISGHLGGAFVYGE